MDKYEVITRPPVSVYARINDIYKEERKAEDSDKDGPAVIDDFVTIKNKCRETDWNNLAKKAEIEASSKLDMRNKLLKNANKYKSMANKWGDSTIHEKNKTDSSILFGCTKVQTTDFIQWKPKFVNGAATTILENKHDGSRSLERP